MENLNISLTAVFDRLSYYIQDVLEVDDRTARLMLMEFLINHEEKAVFSLFGAVRYAVNKFIEDSDEAKKNRFIREVICHDIGGRKDKLMLPRSSCYFEYANS